jgi:hypothetical protein
VADHWHRGPDQGWDLASGDDGLFGDQRLDPDEWLRDRAIDDAIEARRRRATERAVAMDEATLAALLDAARHERLVVEVTHHSAVRSGTVAMRSASLVELVDSTGSTFVALASITSVRSSTRLRPHSSTDNGEATDDTGPTWNERIAELAIERPTVVLRRLGGSMTGTLEWANDEIVALRMDRGWTYSSLSCFDELTIASG